MCSNTCEKGTTLKDINQIIYVDDNRYECQLEKQAVSVQDELNWMALLEIYTTEYQICWLGEY